MKRVVVIFILSAFINLRTSAQNHIAPFLVDMGIKSFKINSTLKDLEKINFFKEHLTFIGKTDNVATYFLRGAENWLTSGFTSASFDFVNDTLKKIAFEKIGDLSDGVFEKTYNSLRAKYGEPLSFTVKNTLYKRYEWDDKGYYLVLKPLRISFLLIFGRKFSKDKSWIYQNRKGMGMGLVKLNISNWEQLVNLNLDVNTFEKFLSNWKSDGTNNHIQYDFDRQIKKMNIPKFVIQYKLNNYDVEATTKDTSTKVISGYKFYNFRDKNIVARIKNELDKSNYKVDNSYGDPTSIVYYNNIKKISVIFTQMENDTSFNIFK